MSLIRNASYFTLGGVVNKLIPFLILPAITHLLDPTEYGMYSMFETVLVTILPIVSVQQHGAVGVNYFKLNNRERSKYISSVLYIPLVMFLVCLATFILFKSSLEEITKIDSNWILILPVVALFQSIFLINSTTLIFQKKPKKYLLLEVGKTVVLYGGGLGLLVFLGNRWENLAFSMSVANILIGVIGLHLIYRQYDLNFALHRSHLIDGLNYGVPLILYAFSQSLIDFSDRYFITEMVGVEYTGLYNIAYRFGMINFFLFKFFQQAWNPHVFEILETGTGIQKKKLLRQMILIPVGILFLALVVSLTSPYYVRWFLDEKYLLTISVIPWVCAAYAFKSIYGLFSSLIFFKKKTVLLSFVTIFNAGLNLLLNYFFIENYGFIGAAYATLITFITSNFLLLILLGFFYRNYLIRLLQNVKILKK